MWKLLKRLFLDERGATLNIPHAYSPNTLISSTEMNSNFDAVEASVNSVDATQIAADAVTAAALNPDVVRTDYGLSVHTTGALQVDVSDTNPCLEIIDGGVRVKVDDSSIERAAGGLQVKALGVTNDMLAGSIANAKLVAIALASAVTGTLPVGNGGTGATAAANAANGVVVLDASAYVPNNSVDTGALKTATGEVSATGNTGTLLTLPGGEYGFYPQVKISTGSGTVGIVGVRNYAGDWFQEFALGSSYATRISVSTGSGGTVYAKQRYVTASGTDHWLFLLVDKVTKGIVGACSASDHPAYGNGGDFDKLPHPFGSYDATKHEIILVDNDTIVELKSQTTKDKSILDIVNNEYKIDTKDQVYKPLHSGQFIDKKLVLVKKIPDYIKVRKLVKLTPEDKAQKEVKKQQAQQKYEQDKIKKNQDKQSVINKLKALGLTEDEMHFLM